MSIVKYYHNLRVFSIFFVNFYITDYTLVAMFLIFYLSDSSLFIGFISITYPPFIIR